MAGDLNPRQEAVSKELTIFVEHKVLSPADSVKLSAAVAVATTMKSVSTPVGQRHFGKIDALISLKNPTPAGQARECLSVLDRMWGTLRVDFHKFRQMHLKAQVMKARLAKRAKAAAGDDIEEAECALEQAEIDALESELSVHLPEFQGALTQATAQADRYAAICTKAGKENFTDEDFRDEEATYLIKSAWWHACQVFKSFDRRNKYERAKSEARAKAKAGGNDALADQLAAQAAAPFISTDVPEEVLIYFSGLGISEAEVKQEVADLEGQRGIFERNQVLSEGARQPFRPYFEAWLVRMAAKYKDRALEVAKTTGMEQLRRINQLVTPTDHDEGGPGDVGARPRNSMFQ